MAEQLVVNISAKSDTKQIDKFNNKIQGLDKLVGKLGKAMAGLFAVATVRKIVNVSDAIQRQSNNLSSLTGNVSVASLRMRELAEMAKNTEFTTSQLTDAFIELKANGLDPTAQWMSDLSGFASFAGASINDVSKALARANLGRMRRISELLGTPVKMDGDRVFAEINGQIVESEHGIKGFMQELKRLQGDEWQKAQERNLNTVSGAMAKMRDVGEHVALKIAEGFAGDMPTTIMQVTESIERLMPLFELVGKVMGVLLEVGTDVFGGLSDLLGDAELYFGNIENWIAALVIGLGALKIAAMVGLAPFTAAGAAVAALGAALFGLFRWIQTAEGETFMDRFRNRAKQTLDWLKGAFKVVVDFMRSVFTKMYGGMFDSFKSYFAAIMALLRGDFSGFIGHLKNAFMSMFDYILQQVGRVLGVVDKAAGFFGKDINLKGSIDSARLNMAPTAPTMARTSGASNTNVSTSVGRVEVKIDGSTNMNSAEVGRSVSRGVDDALGKQTRKLQYNYAGT